MYWKSKICRESDFLFYRKYLKHLPSLQQVYPNFAIPEGIIHRKNWEWCFIIDILTKAGLLKAGKCGLGFAVGEEPLPSYFASKGVKIVATDLWDESHSEQWYDHQNLRGNKSVLNRYCLCTPESFDVDVQIRNVNMNNIPDDIGRYDFCWSSCAVEHVGNLQLGKKFWLYSRFSG